jgi:23S rRNA pseudouridine1911/1915/1917 synthase
MKILYEDNHFIAVEKPALLLTQPSPTSSKSLEQDLKAFIKKRDAKKGNVFLHAVHRLDKEASGIVIFAKTQKALSRLSRSIREQEFVKEYYALVEGTGLKKGKVTDFLLHDHHKATIVSEDHERAKQAELEIIESEERDNLSLVKIRLITGRYHQIRAQLAHLGHPIVGDKKYGSTVPSKGIALHHMRCRFPHPTQQRECEVYSDPTTFS